MELEISFMKKLKVELIKGLIKELIKELIKKENFNSLHLDFLN